ncbi:MAG: tripartite tricarboxylate transporter substrate binding protein [Desulfobacterales bacterium]|nr:tripartite tricarboxylate transporter substrate binding protein [Desulfobacterales bacterium]
MKRKTCLIFLVGVLTLLLIASAIITHAVAAETYPEKDILWIIPLRAGGGYDTYSRRIAPVMSKYLPNKVNVVAKNITGAGGITGVSTVFKSKPDGYTIGLAAYPGMAVANMTMDIGFDPDKLTPLAQIAVSEQALFVSSKSKIKSYDDLKKMKGVRLGTTSRGASMYSFSLVASKTMAFDAELVTGYGGTSAIIPAIMRGDVDGAVLNLTQLKKYIESGDLRPVFTFTSKRHELTPDVPCVAELGVPEATAVQDYKMLFAPPGLPKDRTDILKKSLVDSFNDKGLLEWSQKSSMPLELKMDAEMKAEIDKMTRVYGQYKDLLK